MFYVIMSSLMNVNKPLRSLKLLFSFSLNSMHHTVQEIDLIKSTTSPGPENGCMSLFSHMVKTAPNILTSVKVTLIAGDLLEKSVPLCMARDCRDRSILVLGLGVE